MELIKKSADPGDGWVNMSNEIQELGTYLYSSKFSI